LFDFSVVSDTKEELYRQLDDAVFQAYTLRSLDSPFERDKIFSQTKDLQAKLISTICPEAAFIAAELEALVFKNSKSKVEETICFLLSSMFRAEAKRLLNCKVKIVRNGSINHNAEDPAALLHHALMLLRSLDDLPTESLALEPSVTPSELSKIFLPIIENLQSSQGGWMFSEPVSSLFPEILADYEVIAEFPSNVVAFEKLNCVVRVDIDSASSKSPAILERFDKIYWAAIIQV
jgi:hypothetical protein